MTTPLVSLDDLQQWIPGQPENDLFLERLASLATGVVLDYVGPDPVTGAARTWTETTVPDPIRAAILVVVAEFFMHRGDAAPVELLEGALNGHLSPVATRLLQRYREPVVS